jgi:hypothetical protein
MLYWALVFLVIAVVAAVLGCRPTWRRSFGLKGAIDSPYSGDSALYNCPRPKPPGMVGAFYFTLCAYDGQFPESRPVIRQDDAIR